MALISTRRSQRPGKQSGAQASSAPFCRRPSGTLILGEHVTTDAGTGAVHTAPDHGLDDFYVGLKYGIGTLNLLDEHGVLPQVQGSLPVITSTRLMKRSSAFWSRCRRLSRSRRFTTAMRTAGGLKHRYLPGNTAVVYQHDRKGFAGLRAGGGQRG